MTTELFPATDNAAGTGQADRAVIQQPGNAAPELALLGPGKTYATVEALHKAVLDKEAFINTLMVEKREVEQKYASLHSSTESLKKASDLLNQPGSSEPSQQTTQQSGKSFSSEDVEKIVQKQLDASQRKTVEEKNREIVREQLIKINGTTEKARDALVNRAKQLGMSVEDLQTMAARSPTAALELLIPKGEKPLYSYSNTSSPAAAFNGSGTDLPVLSADPISGQKFYDWSKDEGFKTHAKAKTREQIDARNNYMAQRMASMNSR